MFETVSVALFLGYLMHIWLDSDALVEYLNLFKQEHLFHVSDYNELHKQGYLGNYTQFLREYYGDSFLIRLSTCPLCLSFWLGVFEMAVLGKPEAIISAPLILFSYRLYIKML